MNSTPPSTTPAAPRPKPQHPSYRAHRKQAFWQILLPMILAALVMLCLFVTLYFGVTRGSSSLTKWAEISTIWLTIPVGIGALIMLAVLTAVVYGLGRALGVIPRYTVIVQKYAWDVSDGAKEVDRVSHRPRLIFPWIRKFALWIRERQKEARQRAAEAGPEKGQIP
ncbi:MAG TPA: hypothetical protein VMJ64_09685 [Anaerolineales bacterium]|nr:hypothetical protein [Anaerolineales bacterium]